MGGHEVVVHAWKEWGIQGLVLLSFTLQVTLLVLAEFRRRVRSGVLIFFIWSAYMLADVTAIYGLGHMSVTSRSPEHQLVAFWTPFLLLHLGGQDNITAYAIEDNRLWLRHLQTLAVQVAAAAYILYESSIITGSQPLLRWATMIMFLVGAVKYGERVSALWLASRSTTGKNYQTFAVPGSMSHSPTFVEELVSELLVEGKGSKAEAHIIMAHRMVSVPKSFLKGSPPDGTMYCLHGAHLYMVVEMQLSLMHDIFYTKTEIIHGNWYGICIRMISAVATATAFVLFNLLIRNDDHKDTAGYSRVDVAVTYVLLVGALVLETLSLLRVGFSSWTFPQPNNWNQRYRVRAPFARLARLVSSVRQLVHAADWQTRHWSASMGQYNLLHLSARSRASRSSKMARWMGLEDLWNTLAYSWSIPVSACIEEKLMNQLFERYKLELESERLKRERAVAYRKKRKRAMRIELEKGDTKGEEEEGDEERGEEVVLEVHEGGPDPGEEEAEELLVWNLEMRPVDTIHHLFHSRDHFHSRVPVKLKGWGLYTFGLSRSVEERILAWHIATNIYLTWWYDEPNAEAAYDSDVEHSKQPTAEAVEALSNYMVFLLAARPDMLSPTGSRTAYLEVCYALVTRGRECGTAEELARKLRIFGAHIMLQREIDEDSDVPDQWHFISAMQWFEMVDRDGRSYFIPEILEIGCKLGAMLIRKHAEDTLHAIAQAWVETLCDAALGCSTYAHAKQLSNGGELITVAAILTEYLRRGVIKSFGG